MAGIEEDDTFVFIPAVVKLTPYDRRHQELRTLRDKLAKLVGHPNNERRVVQLEFQIKKAQERFDEERRRDADDGWRRRRATDEWRSGDGREVRNASRRKVRNQPNEDLSHMTTEQKKQRKADQRSDNNFKTRQEAKGVAKSDIEARLAVRQQKRKTMRAAVVEVGSDMTRNPNFGMF